MKGRLQDAAERRQPVLLFIEVDHRERALVGGARSEDENELGLSFEQGVSELVVAPRRFEEEGSVELAEAAE